MYFWTICSIRLYIKKINTKDKKTAKKSKLIFYHLNPHRYPHKNYVSIHPGALRFQL